MKVYNLQRNCYCRESVVVFIFDNIQLSGIVPSELEAGITNQLYKGGNGVSLASFQPISIISCLCLIKENYILCIMNSFLENFSTL